MKDGRGRAGKPLLFTHRGGTALYRMYAAFAVMIASFAATILFAGTALSRAQGLTTFAFLGSLIAQMLATGYFVYVFYRHRDSFTVVAKAIVLNIAGAMMWWGLAQPLLVLLLVNLDQLQLGTVAFAWLWELPVFSLLITGAYIFFIARPLLRIENPNDLYKYTLKFPALFAGGVILFIVVSYTVGIVHLRAAAHLPWLEISKFIMLGYVSALFTGMFFRVASEGLVRPIRKRLQVHEKVEPFIKQTYARGVFVISTVSSVGILLFIGVAVLQSYQQIIVDNVQQTLFEEVGQYVTRYIQQAKEGEENVLVTTQDLHISPGTYIATIPGGERLVSDDFSEETVSVINSRVSGFIVDRSYNEAVIYFFVNPVTLEKIVVIVPTSDYSESLVRGLQRYGFAALIILALALSIITYFSVSLAGMLRGLSRAVKHSRDTNDAFTFNTYTADELEELALAFRYYINQSNELRSSLETKVKQRTEALLEAEEKQQTAELAVVEQKLQFERQKREVAEDVSAKLEEDVRKRTEALRDAVRRLEEIDRIKSEFISLASHQMRTPLTSLRWAQHTLLEEYSGKLTEDQKKIIETTLERTLYMTTLVNELLDVTKIEDRRYELKLESTSLKPLIKTVLEPFAELSERKGVKLVTKISASLPHAMLDPAKVTMALTNIIDNAIKYTSKGGSVTITAGKRGKSVYVEVRDTGIGIPEKDIYRTSSKFFRASNAIAMHTEGSGLGLYITKTIVEKHGGSIEIISEEGEGTTIMILLPLELSAARDGDAGVTPREVDRLGAIHKLLDEDEKNSGKDT